jgi:hypothetical protein
MKRSSTSTCRRDGLDNLSAVLVVDKKDFAAIHRWPQELGAMGWTVTSAAIFSMWE